MTESDNHDAGATTTPEIHEQAAAAQRALQAQSKELASMARLIAPLTKAKTFEDTKKALQAIDKILPKVPAGLRDHEQGGRLIGHLRAEIDERLRLVDERLGKDLAEAARSLGLEMRVISRDGPVVLRIAPLGIVIDRAKGKARIEFAKEVLTETPAEAAAIMKGHASALKALETAFDPAVFHADCFRAWQAARAALGGAQERVEILDFLPYLALQQQKPAFRQNPTQKAFRDYTRAQFAWDVLRLKRARMLVSENRRLNIGVATGTSAYKKNRVIFFEDETGDGEYKLTVHFTKEEV